MTPNGENSWLYAIVVSLLILGFSYFYAQMQFNPEEVAKNIQQYGGFIPGIRPGAPTLDYLQKVTRRITFFGAIYLTLIALVPSVLFSIFSIGNETLVNAMTSTGMLIIVSVALEFDKQLQSLMILQLQFQKMLTEQRLLRSHHSKSLFMKMQIPLPTNMKNFP